MEPFESSFSLSALVPDDGGDSLDACWAAGVPTYSGRIIKGRWRGVPVNVEVRPTDADFATGVAWSRHVEALRNLRKQADAARARGTGAAAAHNYLATVYATGRESNLQARIAACDAVPANLVVTEAAVASWEDFVHGRVGPADLPRGVFGELVGGDVPSAKRRALLRLTCARHLCGAVAFMHEHRIAHGAIAPINVLIKDDGRLALGHFGVAGAGGEGSDTLSDLSGFLAPELAGAPAAGAATNTTGMASSVAREASDVFALGRLLHALLDGTIESVVETPADNDEVKALLSTALEAVASCSEHVSSVRPLASSLLRSIDRNIAALSREHMHALDFFYFGLYNDRPSKYRMWFPTDRMHRVTAGRLAEWLSRQIAHDIHAATAGASAEARSQAGAAVAGSGSDGTAAAVAAAGTATSRDSEAPAPHELLVAITTPNPCVFRFVVPHWGNLLFALAQAQRMARDHECLNIMVWRVARASPYAGLCDGACIRGEHCAWDTGSEAAEAAVPAATAPDAPPGAGAAAAAAGGSGTGPASTSDWCIEYAEDAHAPGAPEPRITVGSYGCFRRVEGTDASMRVVLPVEHSPRCCIGPHMGDFATVWLRAPESVSTPLFSASSTAGRQFKTIGDALVVPLRPVDGGSIITNNDFHAAVWARIKRVLKTTHECSEAEPPFVLKRVELASTTDRDVVEGAFWNEAGTNMEPLPHNSEPFLHVRSWQLTLDFRSRDLYARSFDFEEGLKSVEHESTKRSAPSEDFETF